MGKIDEFTDEYGRNEELIYEELMGNSSIPKDFESKLADDNELIQEYYFLEDDANELLANIGLEQKLDFINVPRNQLKRVFRYYHPLSQTEEEGKKKDIDPLPDYRVGDKSFEEEIFKFGYHLGKGGKLGKYYRLLPDFQFRRGYWVGKMERCVDLNNDDILRELSREIKVYDATQANEEMEYIVNNIFQEDAPSMEPTHTVRY